MSLVRVSPTLRRVLDDHEICIGSIENQTTMKSPLTRTGRDLVKHQSYTALVEGKSKRFDTSKKALQYVRENAMSKPDRNTMTRITPSRFKVVDADGKFLGTVDKQEYTSRMKGRKPITKKFWIAHGRGDQRMQGTTQTFPTRAAAGKFIIEQALTPYNEQKATWRPKGGEA